MEENMKEVYFNEYCPKCIYSSETESYDPCDECLSCPARQYSHKPINYKERKRHHE